MLAIYLKRYPLSLLTILAIILFSLLPIPEVKMMQNISLADKWGHMLMYGGLVCIIWFEYLRSHKELQPKKLALLAFLAPIAMGGLLELLQAYATTCRSGEWFDFAANSIGVSLGTICGLTFAYFKLNRQKRASK